jgi:hypothetical protein
MLCTWPAVLTVPFSCGQDPHEKDTGRIVLLKKSCHFQLASSQPAFLFLQFFALSGFPCPSLMNPSDHFLRTINKDFDKVSTSHNFKRDLHNPARFSLTQYLTSI